VVGHRSAPTLLVCGRRGSPILSGISAPSLWMVAEAAVWVVALHLLYRALWRRALRKYDAVGT